MNGLVIKRKEVEQRPEDDSMDECLEVRNEHSPVIEDRKSNDRLSVIARESVALRVEGFLGEPVLVNAEAEDTSNTNQQRE